jgi:sugar lactone lactonase YvrE
MIRQSRIAELSRRWLIAHALGGLAWALALPAAAGTDVATLCQETIERNGVRYARKALAAVSQCTGGSTPITVSSCLSNDFLSLSFANLRASWASQAAPVCAPVDVHSDLGYHTTCAVAPSSCNFPSAVLSAPGVRNDLLDCLQCRIEEAVTEAAVRLFDDSSPIDGCHRTIGKKGVQTMKAMLGPLVKCQRQGTTSIAACLAAPKATNKLATLLGKWRTAAEAACATIDPIGGGIGYSPYCSGFQPAFPSSCPTTAPPCTLNAVTKVSLPGTNNDLLDCLDCQTETALLAIAREVLGANLCCVGGDCMTVRTRRACRAAGGTPAYLQVDTLDAGPLAGPHGVAVGNDGSVYIADSGFGRVKKVTSGGTVSELATGLGFVTGVAFDESTGNVLVNQRCENQVLKIAPGGAVSPFAGNGTIGPPGDGGLATAASIVAPNRVTVAPDGTAYVTESGFLHTACGQNIGGREKIRVVAPNGIIQTFAGAGGYGITGEGGPASLALMGMPYAVGMADDGGLLIGEASAMRILKVTPGGTLVRVGGTPLAIFGDGGPAVRARFYEACAAVQGQGGSVFVADMVNNRVHLIDRLGSLVTVAGTGLAYTPLHDGAPGTQDDAGCPEDVAVGPDGRAYFASLTASAIRVLSVASF